MSPTRAAAASRARYFAAIGALPLIANLAINFLIGLLLFDERVAWTGLGGLGTDLMIGVGLAGWITAWATNAGIVRGAKAGRVAGLPSESAWRVLPARPLVRTAVLAVAVAGAMALVTIALGPRLVDTVSGLGGALFKGVTSAIGAHLTLVLSGMRALVGAPDRTREHDAAVARAKGLEGQALESLDKGCLACTDEARGISVAPVWHLDIVGDIDDGLLQASLRALAGRYPTLHSRVVPVDGVRDFARDFRYVPGPERPLLRTLEAPVDEVRQRVFDDFIDLFESPPLRVTAVREAGHLHLFWQQHHAIADGRAFMGLLADWAAIVRAGAAGGPTPAGIVPRRPEVEALGLPARTVRRLRRRGFWRFVREALALRRRPLTPLAWNRGRDYSGPNRVVRAVLPVAQLEALRPAREAVGVSLNSLLTAAYLRAIKTWSSARGQALDRLVCEVIVETRPRDGSFVSFANHLSAYLAPVQGAALDALLPAAREVQTAVAREAAADAHLERALFRAWGVHAVPIDALRHLVLDVAEVRAQVGFSNLYSLPIPELAGDGWRVGEVWVTTPAAPPHGIALTATSYGGRIAFNFNFKASVIDEPEVHALADAFVAELRTLGLPISEERIAH